MVCKTWFCLFIRHFAQKLRVSAKLKNRLYFNFFKSMLEFEHSEEFRQKNFKILIKSQNFLENSKQDAKNLNEKLE